MSDLLRIDSDENLSKFLETVVELDANPEQTASQGVAFSWEYLQSTIGNPSLAAESVSTSSETAVLVKHSMGVLKRSLSKQDMDKLYAQFSSEGKPPNEIVLDPKPLTAIIRESARNKLELAINQNTADAKF